MARIVGLDLGSYSVKAVGLSTTLRGYQVSGYWEERVAPRAEGQSDADAVVAAVRALFARLGFMPDTVVCGVPGSSVVTRLLRLPFTDARKIEQVIGFEVGEQLPFDLDDVILDHQVVSTEGTTADALVAAVRKSELSELLEKLKAIGVDPRVVCLDTVPMLGLARQVLAEETQTYAIVDLGHSHTSVSIVGQGGLQYVRTLSRGGKAVTQGIAHALSIDEAAADELKQRHGGWDFGGAPEPGTRDAEIQRAIEAALRPLTLDLRQTFQAHAAQKRGRVERVFLCGGTSRLSGVFGFLSATLGLEVLPLHAVKGPFAELAKPDIPGESVPKALALALRAVTGARGPQMNLRRGEHSFKGDFQYLRGRMIQLSVGIASILVMVGVYAWARMYTLGKYESRQKAQLARVTKATLGEEMTEFSVALNRISRGKVAGLAELLPRTTAFDYLHELSKNIGKEKIDVRKLDVGQKRISLEGEIDSIGALDAVVQSLSQFKCFDKGVRIMKSGKNQLNNRANFQLLITPSC
jgi:general secretion pathway protein L